MKGIKTSALFLVLLLLWLTGNPIPAQGDRQDGFKFITNYIPSDYSGQPQNWSITQDNRGIIYIANQGGLLEFDGAAWRKIPVPNVSVRSLTLSASGTIYIGGTDEFGFLAPTTSGTLQYRSLVHHLDDNQKNFGTVWGTHAAEDGLYFRSSKFLFKFASGKLTVWQTRHIYNASLISEGNVYVQRKKTGLMHIMDNALELIPGGGFFSGMKIAVITPTGANTMLVGTRSNGIFLYDGHQAVPLKSISNNYLKTNRLYHGIRLHSGDIALATLRGGLVIIGPDGRLKQIFDKDSGLKDDNIKFVFQDSYGTLWLALQKGIAKIEYNSPFSVYDKQSNLPGMVLSLTRHGPGGSLVAGTTEGVFYMETNRTGMFSPVPGASAMCPSLLSVDGSLLAATGEGILQIAGETVRKISDKPSAVLVRSKRNPGLIWGGTSFGLVSIARENRNRRQWRENNTFSDVIQKINTIVEDDHGNLWLGTLTKGVLNVRFREFGNIIDRVVTRYGTAHGLPEGEIHVFKAAGHIFFASPSKGLFRFDSNTRVFLPDEALGNEFADGSRGVFRLTEDREKTIWLHSMSRNIQAIPQPNGTYFLNKTPFLRIPVSQVNDIYPDYDGNIIWFAGNNGLFRYDSTAKKSYRHDFPVLVREVSVNGKPVFGGYSDNSQQFFPIIKYRDRRTIGFEFAAPFFEAEQETRFAHYLEGYDEGWSSWKKENKTYYSNLDSGIYRFRVRAKNVYDNLSGEAVFHFKILPPLYKTWWAYLIYVSGFFALVYMIVRWRSRNLQQIIRQRTKEIEGKNRLLEEQSGKLQELDRIKSRFFANISHEFRTPLTLIMGPIEQMLSQCEDIEQQKKLGVILRNSQRLLGLINQLLELSKIDSGNMKLQAASQNIIPFLKGIVDSFSLIASENQLELSFHVENNEEKILLYFDAARLEDVIINLLINAVKFTPPGGRISVVVKRVESGIITTSPVPGFLEIEVSDTGIGIAPENLDHIFDRFYRAKRIREHEHKGTGIGLALTRELVLLHYGEITVDSSPGKGSRFIVRLPLDHSHLNPGEISGPPGKPYTLKTHREIPVYHRQETRQNSGTAPTLEEVRDADSNSTVVILVVEDSADTRDYIRSSLEPLYRVIEAKDGREGLEAAQTVIPDLIISDIMMPEMDGHELCRALKNRRNTSHIPIILLTARASDENVVQGLETGADDYITKPFNTQILCARIKNLIDLRRQLHRDVDRQMNLQPGSVKVLKIDKEFLDELNRVIEENLADPDFNVEALGRKLYMSRANLYRKIHAMTGKTPSEYIRSYRLKRAAQLFRSNFGSVTEVAFEVGFSSRTYFTKCFKEQFHQLPSTYLVSQALDNEPEQ